MADIIFKLILQEGRKYRKTKRMEASVRYLGLGPGGNRRPGPVFLASGLFLRLLTPLILLSLLEPLHSLWKH